MTVYLRPATRKGNTYWSIVEGRRSGDRVRQAPVLYLGRLENLSLERRSDLERRVLSLHNDRVLHTFYACLAQLGYPVPRTASFGLVEEGPFPLRPVDFATLSEALRQDDLTSRDLASLVSRIGLPLRPEELVAVGVRVEVGKKTVRSISLYYRRTSSPRPRSAPTAGRGSRPRRPSTGSSPASSPP